MTSIQTLVNESRAMLKDTTTNTNQPVLSDTEMIAYIKRSINELCFSTDINNRQYSFTFSSADTSKTITELTAGVESALFEYQYLLYHSVSWNSTDWDKLYIASPLENLAAGSATTDLKTCVIYDSTLTFNTAMTIGDKILISGRWKKTDITAVGDTYPLDSACEFASVAYTNAMGCWKKGQLEAGDRWMGIYNDRAKEIQRRVQKTLISTATGGLTLRKEANNVFDSPYFYINRTINA